MVAYICILFYCIDFGPSLTTQNIQLSCIDRSRLQIHMFRHFLWLLSSRILGVCRFIVFCACIVRYLRTLSALEYQFLFNF